MVQAEYNAELARALLRRSPLTLEERQGWGLKPMHNHVASSPPIGLRLRHSRKRGRLRGKSRANECNIKLA